MKVIDKPNTEKKIKIIYNPAAVEQTDDLAELLRIVREEELTRIDFVHHAYPQYTNGGWVGIGRATFIRPVGTGIQFTMVQAVNIPVLPRMHIYKNVRESLYYTLYFPALPEDVLAIDIIEKEAPLPHHYFNFYGVSLERIAAAPLIAPN